MMKGILKVCVVLLVTCEASGVQATTISPQADPAVSSVCADDAPVCLEQSAVALPSQSMNTGMSGAPASTVHIQGDEMSTAKPTGPHSAFLPEITTYDDAELKEPASEDSRSISIAVHEPGTFGLFMAVSLILVIRRMNK